MSTDPRSRAWVEVSVPALRDNFLRVREAVGERVRIIPMVKANGYGLGVAQVMAALKPLDPWGFGVAAVEEGLELRSLGFSGPVLVCSPTPPLSYAPAVKADLIVSISDLQGLERLKKAARQEGHRGRFHLEVDTGMGRAGLDWREQDEWRGGLERILDPDLSWEGVFTHFHSADTVRERSTVQQWDRFRGVAGKLGGSLGDPTGSAGVLAGPARERVGSSGQFLVHACNSPAALRRPDFAADAVRPGIFLYGGRAGEGLETPSTVASLKARIVLLKEVPEGSTLGYGATYRASRRERWATVAIGYGDGLPRLLSNRGEALVRGRRTPIIGRISMDVTVLDVTGVPGVEVGDIGTFFGSDDGEEISVDQVAAHAETISYEVLTGLTPRLPRIWMDDDGY